MKSIYRAHSKEAEAEKNSTKNQNEEQEGGEKKVFYGRYKRESAGEMVHWMF